MAEWRDQAEEERRQAELALTRRGVRRLSLLALRHAEQLRELEQAAKYTSASLRAFGERLEQLEREVQASDARHSEAGF